MSEQSFVSARYFGIPISDTCVTYLDISGTAKEIFPFNVRYNMKSIMHKLITQVL